MSAKSGSRFSDKIMLQPTDSIPLRSNRKGVLDEMTGVQAQEFTFRQP